MKLLIYGDNTREIEKLAEKLGFEIVNNPSQIKNQFDGARNPEIIASYGGDGTFMKCEKDFPGIPKFILKKSHTTKKGHNLPNEEILEKIARGEYRTEEEIKIEASAKGNPSQIKNQFDGARKIIGLNEIIVHNSDPRQAIRYEIFVNGKQIGHEIIGDGVAISTPFGSTGYYRAITDSFFEVGIGIAFNNSTEQSDHMVIKDNSEITVRIARGPAMAYADNHDEEIPLNPGDEIIIKKAKEMAKIVIVTQ
jgi:NAD kinase